MKQEKIVFEKKSNAKGEILLKVAGEPAYMITGLIPSKIYNLSLDATLLGKPGFFDSLSVTPVL